MFVIWLSAALAQDTWPAGQELSDVIHVQLTPEGLTATAGIADAILPAGPIDVPPFEDHGGTSFCLLAYDYSLTQMKVDFDLLSAAVDSTPQGELVLDAQLQVWVNTVGDEFQLTYDVACIDQDCPGVVAPFLVDIHAPIELQIVNSGGASSLDATIGPVDWSHNLTADDIHLDCGTQDLVDIFDAVGIDVYGQLIGLAEDQIQPIIDGFIPDMEVAIEDAFQAANFDTHFDLLGTNVEITFYPSDILINDDGVDLSLTGRIAADQALCMVDLDPGGSNKTDAPAPQITTLPASTHVGVQISTDMLDQGLYSIWRGGLLCQELGGDGGEIGGFPLDSSLLGIIGGTEYSDLFPDTKPIQIITTPKTAPQLSQGAQDLDFAIRDLDVDIYAELDGRLARTIGLSINPDIGIDLNFNGTSGELAVELVMPDTLGTEWRGDTIVAGSEAHVVSAFEGLADTLVSSMITGAIGDNLSFALPSIDGFGLTSLTTNSRVGWTTAEATIGPVPYTSAQGCNGGCAGGASCNTPGVPVSWAIALLAVALLRRRQDEQRSDGC